MNQSRHADRLARIWLVADDYGLSPGVGEGIRALLKHGRISGTGCMTLIHEWPAEAALLRCCAGIDRAAVGIHLTLTDFAPLTGPSALAPHAKLPPLKYLIWQSLTSPAKIETAVHAELDAQLDAFMSVMRHAPDYIDGHQHIHFLPPVRSWLMAKHGFFEREGAMPWLRGAPAVALAEGWSIRVKVLIVALLARGFDSAMRKAGYRVAGPLAGFYDWAQPKGFSTALRHLQTHAPDGCVVMCHPGETDPLLEQRDGLVAARPVELKTLGRMPFLPLLSRNGEADAERRDSKVDKVDT